MNLKHLTDETLHSETHRLNRAHNRILTSLLHHLRENERRRLFSAFKYESLFAYVVGELKYSEAEALRRISAMRLLRDIPEIESKISSGELSLTNLALAQTVFSKEKKAGRPMDIEKKSEFLKKLENQSTRAAQKIVTEISPEMNFKKPAFDFCSIEDETLREKLLRLKGRFAHTDPYLDLTGLLHKICDAQLAPPVAQQVHRKNDRSVAGIKRGVWERDEHKCTNCGSHYAVQEDHRIPRALGGQVSLENMRLLCRNCNQRAAIEFFGADKMQQFLN